LQFVYFRIDCTLSPNELSKKYITNIVTNWLDWAKPIVCTKVTEMLESIKSFSTLCHLNQLSTVRDYKIHVLFFILILIIQEYPQHWTAISEQISFESNLWSELYCPLFAQKTKILITNHWDDVFPVIISDIQNALMK